MRIRILHVNRVLCLRNTTDSLFFIGFKLLIWFIYNVNFLDIGLLGFKRALCMSVFRWEGTFVSNLLIQVLLLLLLLSLQVVFCQVAVLAHTIGVVRFVRMATSMRHLGLTFAMVAIVAHVLGIVLPVSVRTPEDFPALSLTWNFDGLVIFLVRNAVRTSDR